MTMTIIRGGLEKDRPYSNHMRNDEELNEGSNVQREKSGNTEKI